MSEPQIEPGTVFRLENDPDGVSWRVLRFVEHITLDGDEWDSWRCEQIGGDVTIYPDDRNEDGTVDFTGDAILDAIGERTG